MRDWWRRVRPGIASWVLYAVVRLMGMTWRIKTIGFEEACALPGGKILCGWHGRTAIAGVRFRNLGFWAIISLSRDGEMQNRIFTRLGFKTIRGSTGRGGARALAESIKVLREGGTMALTPDGPRGPSGVVQPGILAMSRKTGAWLVPCGVAASPRKHIKSWDRYLVPMPFARCVMIFGEGIQVPPDADEETIEQCRLRLEQAMKRLEAEAERMVGETPMAPTAEV